MQRTLFLDILPLSWRGVARDNLAKHGGELRDASPSEAGVAAQLPLAT